MELNNFLKRDAWKLILRSKLKMSGSEFVPAKLVLKNKDDIYGSVQFKHRCVAL